MLQTKMILTLYDLKKLMEGKTGFNQPGLAGSPIRQQKSGPNINKQKKRENPNPRFITHPKIASRLISELSTLSPPPAAALCSPVQISSPLQMYSLSKELDFIFCFLFEFIFWCSDRKQSEGNYGVRDETDEAGARGAPGADSQNSHYSLFKECEEFGKRYTFIWNP